ncbi:MAG: phosphatase PAP2 family protein [Acidimicrobiales bacterium]
MSTAPGAPGTMWDPQRRWGAAFAAVDRSFDRTFDRCRGRRAPDTVAVVLSNLADYGVVWPLVAAAKARRPGGRGRTVAALGLAGTSSWLVNKSLKALFRRQRPGPVDGTPGTPGTDGTAGRRLAVRPPASSSFPSGHTLASFCTAVVLADRPGEAAAFVGFASGVAVSRIHLRAHHATDVLAGAGVGLVLGTAARAALRRYGPPAARRPGGAGAGPAGRAGWE